MSNTRPSVMMRPSGEWLHRLRRGHYIWLAKEGQYAQVQWPWEPPEPGYITGRLGLRPIDGNYVRGEQTWFVDGRGDGLDGLPLIHPTVGNLPENPAPLPPSELRRINETFDTLRRRIEVLERHLAYINPLYDLDERILRDIVATAPTEEHVSRQLRGIRVREEREARNGVTVREVPRDWDLTS